MRDMLLPRPPIPLPPDLEPQYRIARGILWCCFLIGGSFLALHFLFPAATFGFDFKNPQSTKNTLLRPRLSDGTPRLNGKLSPGEALLLDAGLVGAYGSALLTVDLENKSALPTTLSATLRHSSIAFLYPTGAPLEAFPRETLFRIHDRFYALRGDTLFPFVSANAFHSRYPDAFATLESTRLFERYHVSDTPLGFRIGSLLAFADGVFVVTSENEMRPIGSADIFLALGYHFEDVLSASEEELGIYKRGRIFLLGAPHPDGTLFRDIDTDTLYLIQSGEKHLITDSAYASFLSKRQHPIPASNTQAQRQVQCQLEQSLWPRRFNCTLPLALLVGLSGSDYALAVSDTDQPIDIRTLSLTFKKTRDLKSASTLLAQLKQRVLTRFGLAP